MIHVQYNYIATSVRNEAALTERINPPIFCFWMIFCSVYSLYLVHFFVVFYIE
eukprot:UN02274